MMGRPSFVATAYQYPTCAGKILVISHSCPEKLCMLTGSTAQPLTLHTRLAVLTDPDSYSLDVQALSFKLITEHCRLVLS